MTSPSNDATGNGNIFSRFLINDTDEVKKSGQWSWGDIAENSPDNNNNNDNIANAINTVVKKSAPTSFSWGDIAENSMNNNNATNANKSRQWSFGDSKQNDDNKHSDIISPFLWSETAHAGSNFFSFHSTKNQETFTFDIMRQNGWVTWKVGALFGDKTKFVSSQFDDCGYKWKLVYYPTSRKVYIVCQSSPVPYKIKCRVTCEAVPVDVYTLWSDGTEDVYTVWHTKEIYVYTVIKESDEIRIKCKIYYVLDVCQELQSITCRLKENSGGVDFDLHNMNWTIYIGSKYIDLMLRKCFSGTIQTITAERTIKCNKNFIGPTIITYSPNMFGADYISHVIGWEEQYTYVTIECQIRLLSIIYKDMEKGKSKVSCALNHIMKMEDIVTNINDKHTDKDIDPENYSKLVQKHNRRITGWNNSATGLQKIAHNIKKINDISLTTLYNITKHGSIEALLRQRLLSLLMGFWRRAYKYEVPKDTIFLCSNYYGILIADDSVIDPIFPQIKLVHAFVAVWKWEQDLQQFKWPEWQKLGRGRLTIYENIRSLAWRKLVIVDEQNNEARLLQYIGVQTSCVYLKTEAIVEWNGIDASTNIPGEWKIKFFGDGKAALQSAKQFYLCVNGFVDPVANEVSAKSGDIYNELYRVCADCDTLIDKQSKRLHQVVADGHIPELIKAQKTLSQQITLSNKATQVRNQENNLLNQQYDTIKEKRILQQTQIEQRVNECNQTINEENRLLSQIKKNKSLILLFNEQQQQLQSSSKQCISLINAYNLFEKNNTEFMDTINKYFHTKWTTFESQWWSWAANDIVSWLKYKTKHKNTANIYWGDIHNEIEKRNIDGRSLQKFSGSTLDLIGIHDFNIVVYLMKQIEILTNKYNFDGNTSDDDDLQNDENDNESKIPLKFKCALTKKIMKDPVLAFDANIYEREAISRYLKIHQKSPVTNEVAYTLNLFSCKQLKKEIESYCAVNNKGNEGTEVEDDDNDTLYID